MKFKLCTLTYLLYFALNSLAQPSWTSIKTKTTPSVSIPTQYGTPYKQSLSVGGWEDGIFITRDGLNLYCIYVPIDLFSWTFFGTADPSKSSAYNRGPSFGMDLVTNPIGASEWLQGDILYSHRNNLTDSFPNWQLSNLATPVFSEGAPQINDNSENATDLFVYTSNNTSNYSTDIVLLKNSNLNPAIQGTFLPSPVNSTFKEDNPHIERLDSLNLVLFFDSDDRPNGVGQLDIWYSTSADNGITWTNPIQVSTLNTAKGEQQPHLYKDTSSIWYIYYTGSNSTTGKTEIYRAKQSIVNDWDSWINVESVIGAGNSFGVGEPTLTKNGDISFVLLYADTINGTSTDKYDADPWFLPKKTTTNSINKNANSTSTIYLYPNPAHKKINLKWLSNDFVNDELFIYNSLGKQLKKINIDSPWKEIDVSELPSGIYFFNFTNCKNCSKKIVIE